MTPEHGSRPKPRYGEYADPSAEPQTQVTEEPPATVPAPASALGQQVAPPRANLAGPIPGVPHNLGAKGSDGQGVQPAPQGTQALSQGDPASQSAPNARHAHTPASNSAAAGSARAGANKARPRGADRIVTIILLAVGAYFALSMALSLSRFSLEFSRIADQLEVKDFSAPPMLTTLGTVGAILVLAIYALVLIFSIRRLRARKVTFWAPLVAGVLAWVLFFVLFFIGLNQSTELWQALLSIASDPAAAQQLLERLNSTS